MVRVCRGTSERAHLCLNGTGGHIQACPSLFDITPMLFCAGSVRLLTHAQSTQPFRERYQFGVGAVHALPLHFLVLHLTGSFECSGGH
jgi:hypothetical protein